MYLWAFTVARFWAYFHLNIVIVGIGTRRCYSARSFIPVHTSGWRSSELNIVAVSMPPGTSIRSSLGTVACDSVMVAVSCGKLRAIKVSHYIISVRWSNASCYVKTIVIIRSCNFKVTIDPGHSVSIVLSQVNHQVNIVTHGEAVDVSQSNPIFMIGVSKSIFIVIPSSMERGTWFITSSAQYDCPPPTIGLYITPCQY